MGEVPKESNEDDQKAGECEERLKDLGIFSLRKEMAQEEHHDSILVLKGSYKEDRSSLLHKEQQEDSP